MNERDTPELPPGTNVNGAIIEELVERGGYGTVYRARDKLTGTLFALKFVPLHRAKQWAEREGILAMPFQHKNLVQQVGFSYWPPVLPEFFCLKMIYVEGRPLDVWAWEENPDTWAVVGKLVGVARGLAVAHDKQVVHRDVKEANILVRDEDGEPVLVDFGAARREGQTTITEGLFPRGRPTTAARRRGASAWSTGTTGEPPTGPARRTTNTRWAWCSTGCSPAASPSRWRGMTRPRCGPSSTGSPCRRTSPTPTCRWW
ncbi:protein kinase domain-containing protein [Cystobacter fuscus]